MKRLLLLAALLATGATILADLSRSHGGTYRGPGDTVPPGGGGGGGGGTGPTGPGGPAGPTGGPTGPGNPGHPGGSTPGRTGGTPGRGGGVTTGGVPDVGLEGSWASWWGFNKDAYLQLKAAIHAVPVYTGDGGRAPTLRPSEETIRAKVVPALKQLLATEKSNDIVTGSLVALAKIGDTVNGDDGSSEFEPLFVPFLKDPNQEIAETAAVALGILADDAALPTLVALAMDDERGRALTGKVEVPFRTRAFATYGLGLLGARTSRDYLRAEIVRALCGLLANRETASRDVQVAAVIALGLVRLDWARDAAPRAGKDPSAGRQNQIQALVDVLADGRSHEQIRAHVPAALARLSLGASEDLRVALVSRLCELVAPFSKTERRVQRATLQALGSLARLAGSPADQQALALLEDVVRRKRLDQPARELALIALAQVSGRDGGAATEEARTGLRSFLLETASRGDTHLRPWASLAAGVLERAVLDAGGSTSLGTRETLRSLLADAKSPDEVGALAIGIGITRDGEAAKILMRKLETNETPTTQGYVCVALGLIDARAAIPAIEGLVSKSKYKPELLRQAAIGLGLLGDKELVPKLVDMLNEAQGTSSQAALASALGFIGDARSIDPLVAMLAKESGRSDSARGFAAVALGIVGDREPLPWNAEISANLYYLEALSTLTGDGTGILDIL